MISTVHQRINFLIIARCLASAYLLLTYYFLIRTFSSFYLNFLDFRLITTIIIARLIFLCVNLLKQSRSFPFLFLNPLLQVAFLIFKLHIDRTAVLWYHFCFLKHILVIIINRLLIKLRYLQRCSLDPSATTSRRL